MQELLPASVRKGLYVITVVGTPIVTVLAENGIVSSLVVALWAAFVTGVGALAASHVTPSK